MYDYRGPRPPYGPRPAARDMRPPLPRMAPRAMAPIPIEPEPVPTPEVETIPAIPASLPPPLAPPPEDRFGAFCAANPAAPPCRKPGEGAAVREV